MSDCQTSNRRFGSSAKFTDPEGPVGRRVTRPALRILTLALLAAGACVVPTRAADSVALVWTGTHKVEQIIGD